MFKRLKGLLVKDTIILNGLRAVGTGIILMVLMLFMQPSDMPIAVAFAFPIAAPVMLLVMVFFRFILQIVKLGGVGNIMCIFFTVPGDPLVFLLFKIKPNLAIINNFSVFNFKAIILVYRNTESIPQNSEANTSQGAATCPFAGRILADKESEVLGSRWPSKATILTISNDWVVKTNGTDFGWIDKAGQIRKGIPEDPSATLTPVAVIGTVKGNGFYIDGKKVGELVTW
jgi:hypothetical protein